MVEMAFTLPPMDEAYAHAILNWHYDPPYDLYDAGAGDADETVRAFLDPRYAYHAILDAEGDLVAYCCFGLDARVPGGDYSAPALDIGLGVRPDLTGQGRGHTYVRAVLEFARRTYSPPAFRVTVAEVNQRALRVWQSASFSVVQRFESEFDGRVFLVLVRQRGQPLGKQYGTKEN
jgi:ribosomal-protein-alanine N-acetyltransferase